MSAPTTKALTDAIYDQWGESGKGQELDNEQLWAMAFEAAKTIESAGTTKAIMRAWLASVGLTVEGLEQVASWVNAVDLELEPQRYVEAHDQDVDRLGEWMEAIREASS